MFLEKIKTEGLAHFSYVIGDGGSAAVIDPQLDIETYLKIAHDNHCVITTILETHRNEDFISGASALATKTGADVFHGPNPEQPIDYAKTITEGEELEIGSLRLKIIETPGHTDDSISIAIFDTGASEGAIGVFTGDTLFVGDVGRTDFYPDRAEAMAGNLYDSLQKLLALGDQAILYPAHGSGSVCGAGMSEREFSTIGHERRNSPRLQIEAREAFIAAKTSEHHYKPPYFKVMERMNMFGGAALDRSRSVPALSIAQMKARKPKQLIDVRPVSSFLAAHIPGSIALPVSMISSFAGWQLSETDTIGIICDDAVQANTAIDHLGRIGFRNIIGFSKNMVGMAAAGHDYNSIATVGTKTVARRLEVDPSWTLLDVRSKDEFESGHIDGSQHVYVGEILEKPDRYSFAGSVTVMCGSGARATVAASVLQSAGLTDVDVYFGSYSAWNASKK